MSLKGGLVDLKDKNLVLPFLDLVVEIYITLITVVVRVGGRQVFFGPIPDVIDGYSDIFGKYQVEFPEPV